MSPANVAYPWLSRLNHSALAPEHRFVPRTRAQYLTSVYMLWNLLDMNIARSYGMRGAAWVKHQNRPST